MTDSKEETTCKMATLKDIVTVNDIFYRSKAYWGYSSQYMQSFMHEYIITQDKLADKLTYLFLLNNVTVGFFRFSISNDNKLVLEDFFLDPAYIGKGLGYQMWLQSCNIAKNHLNFDEFILIAEPHAEGFYLKMGCKKFGTKASIIQPGVDLAIFFYKIS